MDRPHGVEAPDLFTSGGIISRHIAANAKFGATVADEDLALSSLGAPVIV